MSIVKTSGIDPEVKRSKIEVTGLSHALPALVAYTCLYNCWVFSFMINVMYQVESQNSPASCWLVYLANSILNVLLCLCVLGHTASDGAVFFCGGRSASRLCLRCLHRARQTKANCSLSDIKVLTYREMRKLVYCPLGVFDGARWHGIVISLRYDAWNCKFFLQPKIGKDVKFAEISHREFSRDLSVKEF